jgi:hypothetical protein
MEDPQYPLCIKHKDTDLPMNEVLLAFTESGQTGKTSMQQMTSTQQPANTISWN